MRMIIVQSEVESFLRHLSLDNTNNTNTVYCAQDLGRTDPQYRRRYDMGEVNTNGYRVHNDLQFS